MKCRFSDNPFFNSHSCHTARIILFFLYLITTAAISSFSPEAQASARGIIAGKVVDAETGEALIGANVLIKGTTMGSATDLQGNYRVPSVPSGTYTLVITYIGYQTKEITDLTVTDGQATSMDISLGFEVLTGQEVVVTARAIRNNETALLRDRQKAISVSDAVSVNAVSRAGGSNAAEAMKQITGASVVEGKFVYVRGLGDRYTSTQLNGIEIPSTNPYRRAGSIDLIPTNMVDNIVTIKSFTPDRPGNFSGGTVDIKTKDFPDFLDIQFSSSLSYNSQTTFNSDGPIGYPGSSTDWIGFDDGLRDVPSYIKQNGVPYVRYNPANLDSLSAATRSFNNQMWVEKFTPPVNQSYSFSIGNQFKLFSRPFGFVGSLSYSNKTSSYDNGNYNAWDLVDQNAPDLNNLYHYNMTETSREVLLGGLLKGSYKISPLHILTANVIFNQNAESQAKYLEGRYDYDKLDAIDDLHQNHVLGYSERRLTSFQFSGEHQFWPLPGSKLEWKAAISKTSQDEPDLRYFTHYTKITGEQATYGVFSNLVPQRYFRYLDETNREFSVDMSVPLHRWTGMIRTLKFGGLYSNKNRNFNELNYSYNDFGAFNGNPEDYFTDQNMSWDSSSVVINGIPYLSYTPRLYITEGDIGVNDYTGDKKINAAYAMVDMPLLEQLRFIGGVRYEETRMNLFSLDERKADGKIDTKDWLPSVNLIYNMRENMNLRTSATRTLARPTMRELAPYASYDFLVGFTYIGNPSLQRTLITNYDIRWEWFSRPGEIIAVSAFYKAFENPIERAFIITSLNREITWINVDKSKAMGLEFEIRKKLDIIHSMFRHFMISANLSVVKSEVQIPADELALMRLKNPDMPDTRELEGQSPYLLNMTLNYDNMTLGLQASLYYNIFGERLSEVNKSGLPYVYEQPFSTLNASFSKKINGHFHVRMSGQNLLNDEHRKIHEYKGNEYIFRSYSTGRTFSVGFHYSL